MASRLVVSIFLLVLIPQRPAGIEGIVSDVSGHIISDATVSLSGANLQTAVRTHGDGRFSFPALEAGDYTLKVNYRGFETFEDHVTAKSRLTLFVAIRLRPQVVTEAL